MSHHAASKTMRGHAGCSRRIERLVSRVEGRDGMRCDSTLSVTVRHAGMDDMRAVLEMHP
jgi:hypothetical protein